MTHDFDPNTDIDITGLNPAVVLAALYNAARPLGMGMLQARAEPMTKAEAWFLLQASTWFDYVHGRPLKVAIEDGVLRRYDLYNRDQGQGLAQRIIQQLRNSRETK